MKSFQAHSGPDEVKHDCLTHFITSGLSLIQMGRKKLQILPKDQEYEHPPH